jgi:hypothetical protein
MIWIVDATVAVKWFLEDELHGRADAVLKRWIDQPECFAVPDSAPDSGGEKVESLVTIV